ncbi:hypothetical protein CWM66_08720 [Kosakonia sp. H7A]|nr:hypothetical protein CWM66_08720 [Kosakonia sp. H7A]
MRGLSPGFFDLEILTLWQERAADITAYFGWSDERAWGMTLDRLMWWVNQAKRINQIRRKPADE